MSTPTIADCCREAGREISRLRAKIRGQTQMKRCTKELETEIERLRALIHPFEGAMAKVEEQGAEIEWLRDNRKRALNEIVERQRVQEEALTNLMAERDKLYAENEAWQVGQEAITDQLSARNREITRLRAVIRDAADDLLTPDALRAALEGK